MLHEITNKQLAITFVHYCLDISVGIGTPNESDSPAFELRWPVCVCSPYNETDVLANVDPTRTSFYPSHRKSRSLWPCGL